MPSLCVPLSSEHSWHHSRASLCARVLPSSLRFLNYPAAPWTSSASLHLHLVEDALKLTMKLCLNDPVNGVLATFGHV